MLPAFVASPFTVTTSPGKRQRTASITTTTINRATTILCMGRGFGTGSGNSGDQNKGNNSKKRKRISDSAPRPPGLTDIPDKATLRAEYEARGIVPPASFGNPGGVTNSNINIEEDIDITDTAEYGTMPEVVAGRMGRRMFIFGGVPITLLFLFFAAYFVLTYKFEIRVIPAVVAYSTLVCIGAAGAGITYGIFSSSWDEDIEGSPIGFAEAKVNLFRAKDAILGLQRREKQDENFDRINRIAKDQRNTNKNNKNNKK